VIPEVVDQGSNVFAETDDLQEDQGIVRFIPTKTQKVGY
jgi:hypothetical protein